MLGFGAHRQVLTATQRSCRKFGEGARTQTCQHRVAFRDPEPCRYPAVLRERWASPLSQGLGRRGGGDLPLWPGPSVCLLHSKEPAALGIGPQSALAVLRSHRPPRESRVHMVLGAQGSGLDQTAALTSSRGRRPLRAPLGGLYWFLDLLTLKAEGGRGTWATSDLCLLCWDLRTACLERGGGRGWGAGQLAQSPRRGA